MHEEYKSPTYCSNPRPLYKTFLILSPFSTPPFTSSPSQQLSIGIQRTLTRKNMEKPVVEGDIGLNLEATELRLGLPGTNELDKQSSPCLRGKKRASPEMAEETRSKGSSCISDVDEEAPPTKGQVVGWPPVRSYRKNSFQQRKGESEGAGMYVKVSMDGAPYLRKIDLKVYKSYSELLHALETMFKFRIGDYSEREGYSGSGHTPAYEDREGDWMLVGDVPWEMFISSCKKLRIMKGSE